MNSIHNAIKILTNSKPLRKIRVLLLVLPLWIGFLPASVAAENQWNLWRKNDNIELLYQPYKDTGLYRVKANLKVNSTISGFLQFITDESEATNWLFNVLLSENKSISDNVIQSYVVFDTLWPAKKRDIAFSSTYQQNSDFTLVIQV